MELGIAWSTKSSRLDISQTNEDTVMLASKQDNPNKPPISRGSPMHEFSSYSFGHKINLTLRRGVSGFVLLILVMLSLQTFFVQKVKADAGRKPNVIFILTDDQGSLDMNCYGAKDLVTPNMDALAARGVRFTQFYSGAPVCSPSRASILTGRNPHRAGMPTNAGSSRGLPPEQITIAEVLKPLGYATAHIGKWHLGHDYDHYPRRQGFDFSFGHMGGCIDNYSHFFYWAGPNHHDLWRNDVEIHEPGQFFGDLIIREVSEFVEKNREQPMFVYFAINMPHYPYQGDVKWLEYYKANKMPYPRDLYAAFVSTVDDRIGKLVEKIKELGLDEDTIIIYQSDHGHSVEIRAHGGGGCSGPYRGHKFTLLEGGIRIPAMISWPGKIPAGEVRTQAVTACDWLPTIASLCGAPPVTHRIDGVDISDIIQSADAPPVHETLCWANSNQRAVLRDGKWKLYGEGNKDELYYLPDDPGESKNLAAENPELFKELIEVHKKWSKTKTDQE